MSEKLLKGTTFRMIRTDLPKKPQWFVSLDNKLVVDLSEVVAVQKNFSNNGARDPYDSHIPQESGYMIYMKGNVYFHIESYVAPDYEGFIMLWQDYKKWNDMVEEAMLR